MFDKVEIEYWPGAKPLANQLIAQGIRINDYAMVLKIQKEINAVNLLFQNNYLTENEVNVLNNLIHERIIAHLSERSEP
jgi:hypothetical protein